VRVVLCGGICVSVALCGGLCSVKMQNSLTHSFSLKLGTAVGLWAKTFMPRNDLRNWNYLPLVSVEFV
jgi:hypothetical protein